MWHKNVEGVGRFMILYDTKVVVSDAVKWPERTCSVTGGPPLQIHLIPERLHISTSSGNTTGPRKPSISNSRQPHQSFHLPHDFL